ncbi:MAG: outer membrane lipoprotein carrier protein LolA [Magnetococcales bacterium]|nr:outer membrane lipoprotein carrier protein LolA [Magnetococcales bacterium]MBF0114072.1 outer membrane lipoprotein carrier protein LolA [Magnetococcales bacterium]
MMRTAPLLLFLAVFGVITVLQAEPLIKEGEILRGRFLMDRHLQGFNKPLRSEGTIVIAPGKGLVWKTEKPFPAIVAIGVQGIHQYVNNDKTFSITTNQFPFLNTLRQLFEQALTGNEAGLERYFSLQQEGNTAILDKRPDAGIDWPLKKLLVRRNQGFVESVALFKENGDRDEIHFLEQTITLASPTSEELQLLNGVAP